jgi:hypothetical protein
MIPLLPMLVLLGADQGVRLYARHRAVAVGTAILVTIWLVMELALCYPDYNLNGYQWVGARTLFGRPSIGYRSVVQTPSDGVEQSVVWLCKNVRAQERVVVYAYPWHIVRAACPKPRFLISPGRPLSVRTNPDYVMVHINTQIRQSWAGNPRGEEVYWEPYDADWLESHFTKVFEVSRRFGIEMANVWRWNDNE